MAFPDNSAFPDSSPDLLQRLTEEKVQLEQQLTGVVPQEATVDPSELDPSAQLDTFVPLDSQTEPILPQEVVLPAGEAVTSGSEPVISQNPQPTPPLDTNMRFLELLQGTHGSISPINRVELADIIASFPPVSEIAGHLALRSAVLDLPSDFTWSAPSSRQRQ